MPRADSPFEVIGVIGDGAYKIDLPSDHGGVSTTFTVGALSPYYDDENLRANSFEEGENVVDPNASSKHDPISLLMEHMGFILMTYKNAFVSCITWLEE